MEVEVDETVEVAEGYEDKYSQVFGEVRVCSLDVRKLIPRSVV